VLAGRPVAEPAWRIEIGGQDVTLDLNPYVVTARYTDNAHAEIDNIQLQLVNQAGLFTGPWCPDEGTRIGLWIGYAGAPLLPCGAFEVAELEAEGPPDLITITALAAGPRPALRTKRSVGYEGKTLSGVASTVAARLSLRVVGLVRNVTIERVTQNEETDLQFLARLADEHGYVTSVRDGQLVFQERDALEAAAATWSVRKGHETRYRLQRRTRAVYRACEVSYHNPGSKKLIRRIVEAEGVTSGDVLKIRARVEGAAAAEARARAELRLRNGRRVEGVIDIEGTTRCMAGTNGTLVGFGDRVDGTYHVASSAHQITRGEGYVTSLEVRQVA
jgi:hypothetical protein